MPTLAPVDVEGALVTYLRPLLGVHVSTKIPRTRPAEHVRVTRAGGSRLNLILERPLLIVECWAADSVAAFDLAARAAAHLGAIGDDPVAGTVLSMPVSKDSAGFQPISRSILVGSMA